MARHNFQARRNQPVRAPIVVNTDRSSRAKYVATQYGKPIVVLEDAAKQTFHFQDGAWVAFGRSIAECRADSDVKQLAQKVNNMTRYEVREILPS